MRESSRTAILEYFAERSGLGPADLGDDVDLALLVDSFGLLELLDFLEAHLGVHLEGTEISAESFGTVGLVVAFVDRLRAEASP